MSPSDPGSEETPAINASGKTISLSHCAKEQLGRIFLTGFMGAGKSTIGKMLASSLSCRFYDTDQLVMKGFGKKSVTAIFNENGEESFRKAENQVIEALCKRDHFVASVGGGTLVRSETIEPVLANGILIYLEAPVDVLYERVIFSGKDRPLLMEPDTEQRFKERFALRQSFYQQAHITVSTDGITREAVVNEILKHLKVDS